MKVSSTSNVASTVDESLSIYQLPGEVGGVPETVMNESRTSNRSQTTCSVQSNMYQPAVNMLFASEGSLSTVPAPETVSASTIVTMNESHVSVGSTSTLPASVDVDAIEGVCAKEAVASGGKKLKYTCVGRPTDMLWHFYVDFPYKVQLKKRQTLGRFLVTTATVNFPNALKKPQVVPGMVSTCFCPFPTRKKLSCTKKRRMSNKRSAEVPAQVSAQKQTLIKEYVSRQPMGSQDITL